MITIDVSNKGDKRYMAEVMKGVARPTGKGTRTPDAEKAKYPFNTMEDNDFLYAATKEERAAITQAFQSKVYAPARERGKLVTMDLAKKAPKLMADLGKTGGYGIWFEAFSEEEIAKRKAAAEVKA